MKITSRISDSSWTLGSPKLKPGTRIYATASNYSEKPLLDRTGAGFVWNADKKMWWTDDPNKAYKLISFADVACRTELEAIRKKNTTQLQLSKASFVCESYPVPSGLNYLPYQKVGIKYGSEKDSVLLADSPGLGKTMQALGILNVWDYCKKVLIICPANGKIMWMRKAKQWLVRDRKIGIGDRKEFPYPDNGFEVSITNYDSLAKGISVFEGGKEKKKIEYFHPIDQIEWDLIICDEMHHCRNKDTVKAKAVFGLKSKKKIAITGTPVYNKLIQLYAMLAWLSPYWKKNYYYFIKTFCGAEHGRWGLTIGDPVKEKLPMLNEMLRQELMVRRTEEDVGLELPPERWIITEFEPNAKVKGLVSTEASFGGKVKKQEDGNILNKEDRFEYNQDVGFQELARIRHETAVAKIPFVLEYIENLLEETDKIIVFSHHHEVSQAIQDKYGKEQVKLTGQTAGSDAKQAAEDRFQSDPTCKIFNGSIRSSGELITLTASHHVVFAEWDWLSATIEQCYKRSKRIGQTKSVVIHALVWAGSLDAKMANTMADKKQIADMVVDGKPEKEAA